jgi:prepilin-type N-terminal cleavage/methylation domain-containing protein
MNWMERAVARRYSKEEGLTLIELLVVILILGILATIVVLGIGAFQDTGEEQACISTARTVEAANAAYYAKNQAWAPDVATLVSSGYLKTTPKADWGISVSGSDNVTDNCTPTTT